MNNSYGQDWGNARANNWGLGWGNDIRGDNDGGDSCWGAVRFVDEVVHLTSDILNYLESKAQPNIWYTPNRNPLLKNFRKGNGQLNYGYTNIGLLQLNSKDEINFNEWGTQLAYVYRFFSTHTLIVGELLLSSSGWNGIMYPYADFPLVHNMRSMNNFLDTLHTKSCVEVACFGGGPASEVAAVVSWLRAEGIEQNLRFDILDKYTNWGYVADRVAEFLNVDLEYHTVDFISADWRDIRDSIENVDIIVMSKFLSALTAHRDKAQYNLLCALHHMRPGAILVYFDNSGGGTTEWLTCVAKTSGMEELFSLPHYAASVHTDIVSANDRSHVFGVKPTSNLKIGFKIFQKTDYCRNQDYDSYRYCNRLKQYHRIGMSKIS